MTCSESGPGSPSNFISFPHATGVALGLSMPSVRAAVALVEDQEPRLLAGDLRHFAACPAYEGVRCRLHRLLHFGGIDEVRMKVAYAKENGVVPGRVPSAGRGVAARTETV